MSAITLDTLGYSKKLMQMGFTQEQAEGFACLAKQKEDADKKAFETFKADVQAKIDAKDEALRKDLATKGDLKETELRLLKWQIGIGFAIVSVMAAGFGTMITVMAKGFHWLGF